MKKYIKYLIIVSCLFVITGCGCSKKIEDDIIKQRIFSNDNEGIKLEEKHKDITYKIQSLTIDDGKYSTVIVNVINNTSKEYIVEPFIIEFYNNDKVIYTLQINDNQKIDAYQGVLIDEAIEFDLSSATKVKYIFN